jgi:hypothetical protein
MVSLSPDWARWMASTAAVDCDGVASLMQTLLKEGNPAQYRAAVSGCVAADAPSKDHKFRGIDVEDAHFRLNDEVAFDGAPSTTSVWLKKAEHTAQSARPMGARHAGPGVENRAAMQLHALTLGDRPRHHGIKAGDGLVLGESFHTQGRAQVRQHRMGIVQAMHGHCTYTADRWSK